MSERRGMVLVAVVGILTLMGLIAASLVATSIRLRQGAGATEADVTLDALPDVVIEQVLTGWREADHGMLAPGATVPVAIAGTSAVTRAATVTRLGGALYLIASTLDHRSGARRRASLVVRAPHLDVTDLSAFVSYTSVIAAAGVMVGQGSDSLACPAREPAAVLTPPGSAVQPEGGPPSRIAERAGMAATHLILGGISVTRLAGMADTVIADGGSLPLSAGRPRLVVATGNLDAPSGDGEGVILVRGRLRLGAARIRGVVLAEGGVETITAGGEITGLVIAGRRSDGTSAEPSRLLHDATFRFAPCIAQVVAYKAVRPWPIRGRAWAELH